MRSTDQVLDTDHGYHVQNFSSTVLQPASPNFCLSQKNPSAN
jgi:hypothetical protein